MGFLNSSEINKYITGDLFKNKLSSLDIPISNECLEYTSDVIEVGKEETYSPQSYEFERIDLAPKETKFIKLKDLIKMDVEHVGLIFPRYSYTLLGLTIPPIVIQSGFSGELFISITNNHINKTIQGIYPGMKLVQFMISTLNPGADSYSDLDSSKYVNAQTLKGSRAFSDDEINSIIASFEKANG